MSERSGIFYSTQTDMIDRPYFMFRGDYLYALCPRNALGSLPACIALYRHQLVDESVTVLKNVWNSNVLPIELWNTPVGTDELLYKENVTDEEADTCRKDPERCLELCLL